MAVQDSGHPADRGSIWRKLTEEDLYLYLSKNEEYGEADLQIMGKAMSELTGVDPEHGVEMAIAFYLLGKVARMFGAYTAGKLPSDDTLRDLAIYAMMARLERVKWVPQGEALR